MAGNFRRQFSSSTLISGRGGDAGSEFSSINSDICSEKKIICDACKCPKRHPNMIWHWDEKCTITICESCFLTNHKDHDLKPHDEAEHNETESYKKFLLEIQSLTGTISTDITKQREMLESVGKNLREMKACLGDKIKGVIEKFENELKNFEKEIFANKDLPLSSESYDKRNKVRRSTEQILANVDGTMKDLRPILDKLVKQFDQVKSFLNKWEIEGMTALDESADHV